MDDTPDLEIVEGLIRLMRETGAVYAKAGAYEITLGPEPVAYEEPKPQFVHDQPKEGEEGSRLNPLLNHRALRRSR